MVLNPAHLAVEESSGIGQARRAATALAHRAELSEPRVEAVALVVTELGTNLVKHAGGGDLFLRVLPSEAAGEAGFEVLSVDRGPGIADVRRARHDGFSTTRTAGNGLGAVDRAMDHLEIHSTLGEGTVARAAFDPEIPSRWEIGVVSRPHPGETRNGDRSWLRFRGERAAFVVIDALGHGPVAADVSDRAADALDEMATPRAASIPPESFLEQLHKSLGGTRGAAVTVLTADAGPGRLRVAGIGNVTARRIDSATSQTFVTYPGIVGHRSLTYRPSEHDWSPTSLLVLHSDGLSGRWDLTGEPEVFQNSTSLLAGLLYRKAQRHDDATILVARYR